MPKRIDSLTEAQSARLTEWGDKWIEIGLRTGRAERVAFEAAAKRCYEHAGLKWPGRVVWVPSPIVMAIAAPVASLLLASKNRGAVEGAVGDAVRGAVRGAEAKKIRKAIGAAISKAWHYYIGGQFWPGGWYWGGAFTSFFREVCELELKSDLWERGKAYEETIQSACWWYPHKDFVMVCERPQVIEREQIAPRGWGSHRLHCLTGPAVGFMDGWGVYAVHGVRVPRWMIENKELITPAKIEAEMNAEIRRVMVELYGEDRYIIDSGLKPIAQDDFGELYRKDFAGDSALVYVRVMNSTPEPDGSIKPYFLSVNSEHYNGAAGKIPHAAIASTWRTTPDGKELFFQRYEDYRPGIET